MRPCPWSVRELIVHSGDKVLLDRITGFDAESLQAEATVQAQSVYRKGAGEPAWMGLEYMSQAVAAFAGIRQRQASAEPKIGMLIGTRRYTTRVTEFPVGMKLAISARILLEGESGLCVFQCSIHCGGLIAEANLNLFQPPNIQHYLEEA